MKIMSAPEAARLKNCTRQAISGAVHRGELDAERIGKNWAVMINRKFEQWEPSDRRQNAGRARWATSKKKGRKSA